MSTQRTLPLAQPAPGDVTVACCYCGANQRAPAPPCLHTCTSCKRDFRVYVNQSGGPAMEITKRAKRFFQKAPTGTESA